MPIRRALISVYDKTGVVEFARALASRGIEILSSGGTHQALVAANVPTVEVAIYTGFPEMMDGRVKTLHPKIHAGLLCRRDEPSHLRAAERHGIGLIDLVAVNLYPFEATCDQPDATLAQKIEKIDIGGPSMLRSAAKNHAAVTVIVDPTDYALVLEEIGRLGDTAPATRARLARTVFRTTARYDALIADELQREASRATAPPSSAFAFATEPAPAGAEPGADPERFPGECAIPLRKVQNLRYGENPHQSAALYDVRLPGASSVVRAMQLHGKELSYNNLMDADAAWELVKEFPEPACAIIKHTNPCGCAAADSLEQAFQRAFQGDPDAAFGSIIALNRPLDAATANHIVAGRFIEVIIAPSFSEEAFQIITTKPKWKANVRLLAAGEPRPIPAGARALRNVLGGLLIQDYDTRGWDRSKVRLATKAAPTAAQWRDFAFAWLVVKHLKSNAICLVKDRELVGAGVGQMSRVNSSRLAIMLAGERARGAVLASDAYFPFPDGVETAVAAGVSAIVQPGGSKGDEAVIAAADRLNIAMVLTGDRHFRH